MKKVIEGATYFIGLIFGLFANSLLSFMDIYDISDNTKILKLVALCVFLLLLLCMRNANLENNWYGILFFLLFLGALVYYVFQKNEHTYKYEVSKSDDYILIKTDSFALRPGRFPSDKEIVDSLKHKRGPKDNSLLWEPHSYKSFRFYFFLHYLSIVAFYTFFLAYAAQKLKEKERTFMEKVRDILRLWRRWRNNNTS